VAVRLILDIHKHKHRNQNTTVCLAFVTNLEVKRDDSLARYGETLSYVKDCLCHLSWQTK